MQFIDLKKQYEVLKEDMNKAIQKVLDNGHYIGGEEVRQLECELAEYVGVKHCLACANGTDALTLALRCFEIGEGDAVFVPDFTFFATAEVVSLEKATPIFVDVEERTFNMDPKSLEDAITAVINEGRLKPKAIIAVDLFGQVADFLKIRKIADKYKLALIEDGAQGFGGSINGRLACSFGDISTTSFFPAKPVGCYGDGGAIFTNNDEHYALLQSLAVHGKGSDKYDNVRIGYNSRLDTIQAAILLVKLEAFKTFELNRRNILADRYKEKLTNKYVTPYVPKGFISSWAQYTLILKDVDDRNIIQAKLKDNDIPTMVYYPVPMHMETAFKNVKNYADLSVSKRLSQTVMSIPMHPYMDDKTQTNIISALME
ncbi:MAG: DegT/DnrJ/EryC1/StrS family aminotransferase [Clostridia bacterium]